MRQDRVCPLRRRDGWDERQLEGNRLLVHELPREESRGLVVKRAELIEQITGELERAAAKWGGATSDDRLDRLTWLRLIDEHRIRATRYGASSDEYRHELVVIAALAMSAIEAHDRRQDEPR